jgi:broad specificity phosphatase PhoE
MRAVPYFVSWVVIGLVSISSAFSVEEKAPGLRDATVLIIRHAEKPESGFELSPAGRKRAEAYTSYFRTNAFGGKSLKLDYLIATADSKNSHRPRLTIEPLGKALSLNVDSRFKNKQFQEMADDLKAKEHGKNILICWHHGEIPNLLQALGADPAKLLPEGKWPTEEFASVIELRFDPEGRLIPGAARCVKETLVIGDAKAE